MQKRPQGLCATPSKMRTCVQSRYAGLHKAVNAMTLEDGQMVGHLLGQAQRRGRRMEFDLTHRCRHNRPERQVRRNQKAPPDHDEAVMGKRSRQRS